MPLLDVDPRVGEHLLDVLASAGVPAYLEPSADVEPYTRALSLPSPPTDRLWVDRDQRRQARMIVDAETPLGPRPVPPSRDDEPSHGLTDAEEERAWQAIIAGFDAPAVDPHPPVRSDPADPPDSATAAGSRARSTGRATRRPPTAADWFGEPPPPVRPGPERDDLIVDPWSDLETGRRGRRRTRGGPADADALPSGKDLDKAAESRGQARGTRRPGRTPRTSGSTGRRPWTAATRSTSSRRRPRRSRARPATRVLAVLLVRARACCSSPCPRLIGLDDRTGLTLGVLAVLAGGGAAGAAAARGPRRGRAGRRRRGLSPG